MSSRLNFDAILVDGKPAKGTLTIDQDWIDVTMSVESRPDPSWEYTDTYGHFHAWADDRTLPTLKAESVHVPCGHNDECEGYHTDEYRCLICQEEVFPAHIVDTNPPPRQTPGRTHVTVEVDAFVPIGWQASIVAGPYFGIVTATSNATGPDGSWTKLTGGPMVQRLTQRENKST